MMNKKHIYQIPEAQLVLLATEDVIATSLGLGDGNGEGEDFNDLFGN